MSSAHNLAKQENVIKEFFGDIEKRDEISHLDKDVDYMYTSWLEKENARLVKENAKFRTFKLYFEAMFKSILED